MYVYIYIYISICGIKFPGLIFHWFGYCVITRIALAGILQSTLVGININYISEYNSEQYSTCIYFIGAI